MNNNQNLNRTDTKGAMGHHFPNFRPLSLSYINSVELKNIYIYIGIHIYIYIVSFILLQTIK